MKTTTEMQLVPITKLVPYVNNARTHSPEQINKLRSSLREFGFINPVIIDRDYGVIDGGRISKLMLKRDGKIVCNYDRGWDIEPADENTQLALELLLHSENW